MKQVSTPAAIFINWWDRRPPSGALQNVDKALKLLRQQQQPDKKRKIHAAK